MGCWRAGRSKSKQLARAARYPAAVGCGAGRRVGRQIVTGITYRAPLRPSPICCLPLGFRSRARHTAPGRRQARAIVFSFSLSLFLDLPCVQCTQTQPCCLINNPVKSAVKPTPPNPFFIRIHQAYSTFLFSLASLPTALQGAGAPSVLAGSRLGRRPPSVRERDRAPPAPQHARPRCRALRALAASAAGLVAMAMAARCDGATASSQ